MITTMEKTNSSSDFNAADVNIELSRLGKGPSSSRDKTFLRHSAPPLRNESRISMIPRKRSSAGVSFLRSSAQPTFRGSSENDNSPPEGCREKCCGCSPKKSTQSWLNYLICSLCNAPFCARSEETSNGNNQTLLCFWKLPCCIICFPGKNVLKTLSRCVDTQIYNIITIFFTLYLLFADSFRILWFPEQADIYFVAFGIVCLIFFVVDIYLACLVVPNYFSFKMFCFTPPKEYLSDQKNEIYSDNTLAYEGRCCGIKIGSLLFWCDLVCLIPLLLRLLKMLVESPRTINIQLNDDNFLDSALEKYYDSRSIFIHSPHFFNTIATTARYARFIRVSFVAKFTSKLNFSWLGKPFEHWKLWCSLRKRSSNCSMSPKPTRSMIPEKKQRGKFKLFCGCFGLADDETRRNEAAIVIQRFLRESHGRSEYSQESQTEQSKSIQWYSRRKRNNRKNHTYYSQRSSGSDRQISGTETKTKSQVGQAMRELTGQRVAVFIIVSLLLSAHFSYRQNNSIIIRTMGLLHVQTTNPIEPQYARRAVDIAQEYIVPNLYEYQSNDVTVFEKDKNTIMRRSDILIVNVTFMNDESNFSVGYFNYQDQRKETEMYMIFLTLFITMVWFFGVAAFTGPVMYLVVIPIERMILLLSMLMKDPLGYQSTRSYMTFMSEEDQFTQNSQWTKDVLKGMETSFLMSTILRIGSLMKVGFGSAGVDIIRKNLEKGLKKEITFKNLEGSMVSCVFLFSDIRQFTDATECLKEEVFVFTNKIAEVVHSICNSYGGAANKNIGDAFLVSWALENPNRLEKMNSFGETLDTGRSQFQRRSSPAYTGSSLLSKEVLHARHNQAEKALLSVVKICIALHNDDYFLESLSDRAKQNLKDKLQKSPIVQMGFGLHAGTAVQGAIGSQRKIDATFISEAVELSESLEGLTKRYGVEMLMSGQFHSLLPNPVARKCRKIDQIIVNNDDEDEDNMPYFGMYPEEDDILKLYTYDMDIKGYYVNPSPVTKSKATISDATANDTNIAEVFRLGRNNSKLSLRDSKKKVTRGKGKFTTPSLINGFRSDMGRHTNPVNLDVVSELPGFSDLMQEDEQDNIIEELILPNGPALYHADIWTSKEFRRLRSKYEGAGTTFPFLKTYESGLTSYYHRDWELAHDAFTSILARFDDGPSRYFLGIIDKNNKIAPRNFSRYGSIH